MPPDAAAAMKQRGISKAIGDKELRVYIVGVDPLARWVVVRVEETVQGTVTFTSAMVSVVVPFVFERARKEQRAVDRSIHAYLGSQFMPLVGLYLDAELRSDLREHFIQQLAGALNLQVRQARHVRPVGGSS